MHILTPVRSYASPTSSTFSAVDHNLNRLSAESLEVLSKGGSGARAAGVAPPLAVGSLGTNAKCSAPSSDKPFDPMAARVSRFALQSVARKFLPDSRTNNCLRLRAFGQDVKVIRSLEFKTASYTGLQTCGSVWACPVCAAKIAERRRVEIQVAMSLHGAAGGGVLLLTATTPHQRIDKLSDLLAKQALTLKYFKQDKTVRNLFKAMGIIGQIRALEVTHVV